MIKFLVAALFFHSFATAEYYSQHGQDQFVNETIFKNFKQGVFIDIGAHNGISLNNTYFFERELDWSGICLEPNPQVFDELKNNRSCSCLCGCAAVEHNIIKHFLKISGPLEMLSGLIDKFDSQHVARIERQLKEYGGFHEIIDVHCYNLNQILEEAGIDHVHFLSIDTEGGEFEILQNFDFSKCLVDVIAVEDNYHIHPFIHFLESKGFHFVRSLEQDLIFVNKNSRWIQENAE